MANKIGFRHYDDDKSTQNGEQSPKKEEAKQPGVTDKDLFRLFIQNKYQSFGPTSAKVFKSSRDLAYEAREMCSPSLPDIASVMTELEYGSEAFMGNYTWVLYERDTYDY